MGLIIPIVLALGIMIMMIASMWTIFSKAGKPGWASIIPIYNIIVMLEIAKKPIWWFLLFLIPLVNFVIIIMVWNEIAKAFGRTSAFTIGIFLLPIVFIPMLAFGSEYQGGENSNRSHSGDALLDN